MALLLSLIRATHDEKIERPYTRKPAWQVQPGGDVKESRLIAEVHTRISKLVDG